LTKLTAKPLDGFLRGGQASSAFVDIDEPRGTLPPSHSHHVLLRSLFCGAARLDDGHRTGDGRGPWLSSVSASTEIEEA